MQALVDLNLRVPDAMAIVAALTVRDYDKGPEQDRDKPGDLWFFCGAAGLTPIYVKLKIWDERLLCISFHEPEWPMYCPKIP